MIIAQVSDNGLQVVDRMREMVQLGAGLSDGLELCQEAQNRALDCLERFGQRLRDMPPGSVRAVGTNTLRKARSSGAFLDQAQRLLGHPINVIAGREEARLVYLGVSHSLPMADEQRLVIDIGGGSTELIIGRRFDALFRESLYMGCVSMSQRFFGDGKISRKRLGEAELHASLELQSIETQYRGIGWHAAVGASGTILNISEMLRANGWTDGTITRDGMKKLRKQFITLGTCEALAEIPGIKSERCRTLPGGLAVLLACFERLKIKEMVVSDGALREGVLYDLLGRLQQEDVRERSVQSLAERFATDRDQAERVRVTAQFLLRGAAGGWQLEDYENERMLSWAAQLHEVGLAVAHNQFHKHGAYLVNNSDMPGFSRVEQALLALLVRGHRRKVPVTDMKALSGHQQTRALRLLCLLRLSVLLHRTRSEHAHPDFSLGVREQQISLCFPPGWLTHHPLTHAELQQEAAYLKAAGLELLYR